MRCRSSICLGLVSALTLGCASGAFADIIQNGGFQTGDFTGWTLAASPSDPDPDTDLSYDFVAGTLLVAGSTYTPVSGNSAWLGSPGVATSLYQNLTTSTGAKYTLSFALEHDAAIEKLLATFPAGQRSFSDLQKYTLTQMQSLPQMKANIEVENLQGLITANGDTLSAEMITANIARRTNVNPRQTFNLDQTNTGFMIDRELYTENNEAFTMALFRLFLEPLGVAVDTWSLSVNSNTTGRPLRSETYTFGDVFTGSYIPALKSSLMTALGYKNAPTCGQLAAMSIPQYLKYVTP